MVLLLARKIHESFLRHIADSFPFSYLYDYHKSKAKTTREGKEGRNIYCLATYYVH